MTKEDILRTFLEDELFVEKKYLKDEEAKKFRWSQLHGNNLIDVIKVAIEGELQKESANVTEKKINTLLNR
ncbi:hypothetical protein [Runella sp. SP2]|uniref:hypothetical protein n=1 Tax=Runella sp. SP2 TaxID=2268026 RepID=UPI000F07A539|nr:hypothetical protein [Runella sp. SP2]AYQ35503.1 hypothetical protein DTQ70_26535 [Runella sp. SP2]